MNALAQAYRRSVAMFPIPAEEPPPPARRFQPLKHEFTVQVNLPPRYKQDPCPRAWQHNLDRFTLRPKSTGLGYAQSKGWLRPLVPRARFHRRGNGFWTVRSWRADNYLIQGVGLTLDEAYTNWKALR